MMMRLRSYSWHLSDPVGGSNQVATFSLLNKLVPALGFVPSVQYADLFVVNRAIVAILNDNVMTGKARGCAFTLPGILNQRWGRQSVAVSE